MTEFFTENNDVTVSITKPQNDAYATVRAYNYPDGSSRATMLNPDDLRELAEMFTNAADELEELR